MTRDSFFFFLLIFRENLREFYCGIANKKSNDDSTMVLLLVRNIHLGIRSKFLRILRIITC